MTTLLIDNLDSFTWNVYQILSCCGANVVVYRSNEVQLEDCIRLAPRNIVISPGPGSPSEASLSLAVINEFQGKVPILGICLGHQCIIHHFGGKIAQAGEYLHGKTSKVIVDQKGLFKKCPAYIKCMRYHSLVGNVEELPDDLIQTARTENGCLMGIRHKKYRIEGVQFHPESAFSSYGKFMFEEFLSWEDGCTNDVFGILETIFDRRKELVREAQEILSMSYGTYERIVALNLCPKIENFYDALKSSVSNNQLAVVGEFKRRSPSIKDICINADLLEVVTEYAHSGIPAVSILTEPEWFAGNIQDLYQTRMILGSISEKLNTRRLAILRKDFIFCKYQVLEARVFGADSILLIVSILDDDQLSVLLKFSREMGMEPLVEVATGKELERAIKVGCTIIGINNRDLGTFKLNKDRFKDIKMSCYTPIPQKVILVSLSGIFTYEDASAYKEMGANAILVGGSLMTAKDKRSKISELTLLEPPKSISEDYPIKLTNRTLIKICGIGSPEASISAAEAGADMVGLVYTKSKRKVSPEVASKIRTAINRINRCPELSSEYEKWKSQVLFTRASSSLCVDNDVVLSSELMLNWYESQVNSLKLASANRPLLVGIFTHELIHEINEMVRVAKLDMVQLHTEREPDTLPLISAPVIQLVFSKNGSSLSSEYVEMIAFKYACKASLLLFDTFPPDNSKFAGGSGKVFDWSSLKNNLPTRFPPFALAGGLSPKNVKDSIAILSPACVDVSSGVEKAGTANVKDYNLMVEFVNAVKEADSKSLPHSDSQIN